MIDPITVRNGFTAMQAAQRLAAQGVRICTSHDLAKFAIVGEAAWGWEGFTLVSEVQTRLDYFAAQQGVTA